MGLLLKLALSVVLGMLAPPAAQADTPGLPFTGDFNTTNLRDDALTDANGSPEKEAVKLAWSHRRQRPFGTASSGGGELDDARAVVLGDVNGDGYLDLIVGTLASIGIAANSSC